MPGGGLIGVGAPGLAYALKESGVDIPFPVVVLVGIVSAAALLTAFVQFINWARHERLIGRLAETVTRNSMLFVYGAMAAAGLLLIIGAAVGFSASQKAPPGGRLTETPIPHIHANDGQGPLWNKVNALVAKRGKVADENKNFSMGDASDGRGPFITSWDHDALGPWPIGSDGFSDDERRLLPGEYPRFTTQHDRERLRLAVDRVSTIAVSKGSRVTDLILRPSCRDRRADSRHRRSPCICG